MKSTTTGLHVSIVRNLGFRKANPLSQNDSKHCWVTKFGTLVHRSIPTNLASDILVIGEY